MFADSAMYYKDPFLQMSGAFAVNSYVLGVFPVTLIRLPPARKTDAKKRNESNKTKQTIQTPAFITIDHRTVKRIT